MSTGEAPPGRAPTRSSASTSSRSRGHTTGSSRTRTEPTPAGTRTPPPTRAAPRRRATGDLAIATVDQAPPEAVEAVRYLIASLHAREDATVMPVRLAFSSALSGEGVTYVARLAAAVLAHDFRERVCVVDLNWGTDATQAGDDDGPRPAGLAQVLRDGTPLDEVVLATDDPRLTVVSAGDALPGEGQVFARGEDLAQIIKALDAENDRLVLDLPAVLASSAAIPLARHADAVGLVVRQGVTTEAQVRSALDRLGSVTFAGIVLNRYTSAIPGPLLRRLSDW